MQHIYTVEKSDLLREKNKL